MHLLMCTQTNCNLHCVVVVVVMVVFYVVVIIVCCGIYTVQVIPIYTYIYIYIFHIIIIVPLERWCHSKKIVGMLCMLSH